MRHLLLRRFRTQRTARARLGLAVLTAGVVLAGLFATSTAATAINSAMTLGGPGANPNPLPALPPNSAPRVPTSSPTAAVTAARPATTIADEAAPPAPGPPRAMPSTSSLNPAVNIAVNIAANIAPSPGYQSSCQTSPRGAPCQNAARQALNHARAVLGLAPYALPAGFESMSLAQQLLVLSNSDRAVYGLQRINAVNSTVLAAAQQGITNGDDPVGVDVGGYAWSTWASNWAAGYASALFTYYYWMYDDGINSGNISCTATDQSGCWGHRLNTLHNFGPGMQIVMGVGSGPNGGPSYHGQPAFTELYESFASGDTLPA